MKRCNGLIPTPQGLAPYGVAQHVGPDGSDAGGIPDALIRRGGDQSTTESCVWWGIAGGLWALLGILGYPQQWLSVLAGYGATRAKAIGGRWDRIADVGCNPTVAAEVLREIGWCSDERWPFLPAEVNTRAPWDVWTAAVHEDWLRLVRLPEWGAAASRGIRQVLDAPGLAKRPILRGGPVDQAYLDMGPTSPPWSLTGKVLGRHMELCSRYDTRGLYHVSSWGESCDRCEAWDQVESSIETDTWIADVDEAALAKLIGTVLS